MNQIMMSRKVDKLIDKVNVEYTGHTDSYQFLVISQLPSGVYTIAHVGENFGLVNQVSNVEEGNMFYGESSRLFMVCEELFQNGVGRKPDENKSVGANSIDTILEILREPFIMIAYDPETSKYAIHVAQYVQDVNSGKMLNFSRRTFGPLYLTLRLIPSTSTTS